MPRSSGRRYRVAVPALLLVLAGATACHGSATGSPNAAVTVATSSAAQAVSSASSVSSPQNGASSSGSAGTVPASPGASSGAPGVADTLPAGATASSGSAAASTAGPAPGNRKAPTLRDFGSVTFTADAGHAASGKVGGSAATTVKATGADGTVWTLSVPAGALPSAQQVTLTPMGSVGGNQELKPVAGIVFAPDGLHFSAPATLAITGPGAAGFFYLGTARGADLAAAAGTPDGKGFQIPHFSAGVSSPTPPVSGIAHDPDQAAADLRADLDMLLQDAKDDDATPKLPSGALSGCRAAPVSGSVLAAAVHAIDGDGESADAAASAEIMAYTGHIDPDRLPGMWATVRQLDQAWAQADARRIIRVIRSYDDQPEHAPEQLALMQEVVQVSSYDPSAAPVADAMGAWSDNVAFALVERVQDDHDYEMIPLVLQLAQTHDDSGRGVKDSVAEALKKALRFKETFDYTVTAPAGTYHATLTGNAQVASGVATTELNGTGDGKYVSGSLGGGQGMVTPGQAWSTHISINLHPCDHTAEFSADAYGKPEAVTVHGITVTSPLSGMDRSMQDALLYLSHGNFFPGTLANKQARATAQKSWSGGGAQISATLTLTHDPEAWKAPPPEGIPG